VLSEFLTQARSRAPSTLRKAEVVFHSGSQDAEDVPVALEDMLKEGEAVRLPGGLGGVGKYAERLRKSSNIVALKPDAAEVFPMRSSEQVSSYS